MCVLEIAFETGAPMCNGLGRRWWKTRVGYGLLSMLKKGNPIAARTSSDQEKTLSVVAGGAVGVLTVRQTSSASSGMFAIIIKISDQWCRSSYAAGVVFRRLVR